MREAPPPHGSLFEFTRRFGLDPDHAATRLALILATVALAWAPIVALLLIAWAVTGTVDPLLVNAEIHARLLGALGLLLLAELGLAIRIGMTVRSVANDGLLAEPDPIAWTTSRAADPTWVFDLGLATVIVMVSVFAYLGALPDWAARWLLSTQLSSDPSGASDPSRSIAATLAWGWYVAVAQPLLLLVIGRWIRAWIGWGVQLWRLARLGPIVRPAHTDRCGGLGFLGLPLDDLRKFLLAAAVTIAAAWFDEIAAGRAVPTSFANDLVLILAVALAMLFGPYLPLSVALIHARRHGRVAYAALLRRYLAQFDARWLGQTPSELELLGHPDLSGLADLGTSVAVVYDMRSSVPSLADLRSTLVVTALPFVLVALHSMGRSTAELLRGVLTRVIGG